MFLFKVRSSSVFLLSRRAERVLGRRTLGKPSLPALRQVSVAQDTPRAPTSQRSQGTDMNVTVLDVTGPSHPVRENCQHFLSSSYALTSLHLARSCTCPHFAKRIDVREPPNQKMTVLPHCLPQFKTQALRLVCDLPPPHTHTPQYGYWTIISCIPCGLLTSGDRKSLPFNIKWLEAITQPSELTRSHGDLPTSLQPPTAGKAEESAFFHSVGLLKEQSTLPRRATLHIPTGSPDNSDARV